MERTWVLRTSLTGCVGNYPHPYPTLFFNSRTQVNINLRDAVTPNQDFIISPHPHCKNLYLATGGSFHSWKFMPTIGKYVVQMLDGTLDEEKVRRWAWDRENNGAA